MLEARFEAITTDPLRLGEVVAFIESDVRPAIGSLRDSLGMTLCTNPELGAAVFESFWDSREALLRSEERISPDWDDAIRRAVGTVRVDRFAVPVFEREIGPPPGAGVRLTRMDVGPKGVEDAVEIYGDTAVPWLAETAGFCDALLLTDHGTGHLISEDIWLNPQALAASRSVAAAVRAEIAESGGFAIRTIEEYSLVFSTARTA